MGDETVAAGSQVKWRGTPGRLEVSPGHVSFQPDSGAAPMLCCGMTLRNGAQAWPITDVVGVTSAKSEELALTLHTCPGRTKKQGRVQRQHKCIGPLQCSTGALQLQLMQQIRGALQERAQVCARGKQVLIIANPASGKGRSNKFGEEVGSILKAAGYIVQQETTRHAHHATQIAAALDLAAIGCIAVVGGDGTFHEVLQGIARHASAEQASKVPLCHVPGGSGNGIAASCGLWTPATAAHAIVHGASAPLDAATVLQPRSGSRYLAALSVQYGMMTNLDIDTEHLRDLLGGERFTFGAVREILKFKAYEAQLAWVPEEALAAVQARCEKAMGESGGQRWPPAPILEEVQQQSSGGDFTFPEGWSQSDTAVRFFNLCGPPWVALDYRINPWAALDDGLWELATDKCTGRKQALQMLLATQSGKHETSDLFDVVRVGAFAITPKSRGTHLTVDGEEVAKEPLLMQVHRGLLRTVMAPQG